jgi:hypothetical protein
MRTVVRARRLIDESQPVSRRVFNGTLAEDYDGIGQYVLVALSGASVGAAYRARIAAGDFKTGQIIPRGTPVTVFSERSQLEILSLGAK